MPSVRSWRARWTREGSDGHGSRATHQRHRGRPYAKISLARGRRKGFALPTCRSEEEGKARVTVVVALARIY